MSRKLCWIFILVSFYSAHGWTAEKSAGNGSVKSPEEKEVAKPSSPVIFTEAARAELKAHKNKKWLISYNGTCGDAPALGFYPADGGADSECLKVEHEGVVIMIEKKIVSLFEKWGSVTVDCIDYNGDKPGGKSFLAEFKAAT